MTSIAIEPWTLRATAPRHGQLDDHACSLVDVLIGLRDDGFFHFRARPDEARLLFVELQQALRLQSAALRIVDDGDMHEVRLGAFPGEQLS